MPDALPPVRCLSCGGSGVYLEDHGYGRLEPLSCMDCRGEGLIGERSVRAWIDALHAAGYAVLLPHERATYSQGSDDA